MADSNDVTPSEKKEQGSGSGSTATIEPKKQTKAAPKTTPNKTPPKHLPPFKVLLHNDDKNDMEYVVSTILELTTLNENDAIVRMTEAHKSGVALLLVTHKERAELYQEQFTSKQLVVSIEPAE
jgi:ATP-dependent Clp protease adaptor protein ClpS